MKKSSSLLLKVSPAQHYLQCNQSQSNVVVATYEQALLFLSASDDTNDEFITTMFSVKVCDSQTESSGRKFDPGSVACGLT